MFWDPGLIAVIAAVLFFYLRLILLQRARAKEVNAVAAAGRAAPGQAAAVKGKARGKGKSAPPPPPPPRYSIISPKRTNRIIGGVGLLLLLVGVLLNTGLLPWPALQPYWWLPSAAGIILFSWTFAL